jgi:hypothetical protein
MLVKHTQMLEQDFIHGGTQKCRYLMGGEDMYLTKERMNASQV